MSWNNNRLDHVRFWIRVNGCDVLITVHQGDYVYFSNTTPNEEGYSFYRSSYQLEGMMIRWQIKEGGKDCDGIISDRYEYECSVFDLRSHESKGLMFPRWKRTNARHYDQYAQLANY